MLESEFFFGLSQENAESLVAKVLGWDNVSFELVAYADGYISFRNGCSGERGFGEAECFLEELDALVGGCGCGGGGSCGSVFVGVGNFLPFLEELLKPNNVSDLVGFS